MDQAAKLLAEKLTGGAADAVLALMVKGLGKGAKKAGDVGAGGLGGIRKGELDPPPGQPGGAQVGVGGNAGNGAGGNVNPPDLPKILLGPIKKRSDGGTVPQRATDALDVIKKTGNAPIGYKGGKTFQNDGRGGGAVLPKTDSNGNPITYREFDVNPYQPGVNRGAERIVLGSDGKSYYTGDHYTTFTDMD